MSEENINANKLKAVANLSRCDYPIRAHICDQAAVLIEKQEAEIAALNHDIDRLQATAIELTTDNEALEAKVARLSARGIEDMRDTIAQQAERIAELAAEIRDLRDSLNRMSE